MGTETLGALDLDKLNALDVLLRRRNVSAAARELQIAQPTLSHILATLRKTLGDPLLVRHGNRMVPTARAERLREPLALAIEALRRLGREETFLPQTAVARFRVASTDFLAGLIMPRVVSTLRREAPNMRVELHHWGTRRAEALATDELDLGLGTGARTLAGIYTRTLFTESFVCIAARTNRRAHAKMTLEAFAALPHLQLTVKGFGGGAVDVALAREGLQREVVVAMPYFWLAANFIVGTDLVATVPARLAQVLLSQHPQLKRVPLPLSMRDFTITLLWHERWHHDEAHRWLRRRVAEAADEIAAP